MAAGAGHAGALPCPGEEVAGGGKDGQAADGQDQGLTKFEINALTAFTALRETVHAMPRAGEWLEVRRINSDPGGFVVKAQLINDIRTSPLVDTLRSLLGERLITQNRMNPSDLRDITWAVGLDEISSGTAAVYARSAGCTAGGAL